MGAWTSFQSLWGLLSPMSRSYWKRFRSLYNGESCDLEQAASVALLEYQRDNPTTERIRELVGIGLIHKAMVAEVRANRKQSAGEEGRPLEWVSDRTPLTEKQIEILNYWTMIASKAAKSPLWEVLNLRKGLGWSEQQISKYFASKKDTRYYYSPEQIQKMVATALRRIKKKVPPDIVQDVRWLQFQP